MAKKVTTKKETIGTDNSGSAIKYQGEVTIQCRYGNKVYRTRKIHNKGCEPIFQFLATCLTNEFTDAEPLVPSFLRAYHITNTEGEIEPLMTSENEAILAAPVKVSKLEKRYGHITVDGKNVVGSEVDFTFMIGHNQFIPEGDSYVPINVLAIYSSSNSGASGRTHPSAYIVLNTPFVHSELSNYIITWTMKLYA